MKKQKRRLFLLLPLLAAALLLLCLSVPGARHALRQALVGGGYRSARSYTSTLLSTAERDPADTDEGDANSLAPLRDALDRELRKQPGQWDVWVESLDSGDALSCRRNLKSEEPLVSASLIKLFIMGAVYERIERGVLDEESVRDALSAMITVSDNQAANTLTELLGDGDSAAGMRAVTDWAASIGCRGVEHNRLMLAGNGLENYVTAEACAQLLARIYRGECVSARASGRMLSLLRDQQVNDRIPAGLPEGTAAAHKTGDLSGLCSADVGIVFSPGGDYILCAVCNHPDRHSDAAAEIVRLSGTVYRFFNP